MYQPLLLNLLQGVKMNFEQIVYNRCAVIFFSPDTLIEPLQKYCFFATALIFKVKRLCLLFISTISKNDDSFIAVNIRLPKKKEKSGFNMSFQAIDHGGYRSVHITGQSPCQCDL